MTDVIESLQDRVARRLLSSGLDQDAIESILFDLDRIRSIRSAEAFSKGFKIAFNRLIEQKKKGRAGDASAEIIALLEHAYEDGGVDFKLTTMFRGDCSGQGGK